MRRFAFGLLFAIGAYFVAAFMGYWLLQWTSSNHYDRSMEALAGSIFVYGPLGFCIGFVTGLVRGGPRKKGTAA